MIQATLSSPEDLGPTQCSLHPTSQRQIKKIYHVGPPGLATVCQLQPETCAVVRFTTTWSAVGGVGFASRGTTGAGAEINYKKTALHFISPNLWLSLAASPPTAPSGSLNNRISSAAARAGFESRKCTETERTAPQVERKTMQRTTVFPAIIHGAAGTEIGTHLTFYQGCWWINPLPQCPQTSRSFN